MAQSSILILYASQGLIASKKGEKFEFLRRTHCLKKNRTQRGIAVSPAVIKFHGCLKIKSTIIPTCT